MPVRRGTGERPTQPPPKPVYTNQPNYMFPELQGLPEEFRRLADLAQERLCYRLDDLSRASYEARQRTWEQAAQMLEERLNGA